jgi:hypothetical protein
MSEGLGNHQQEAGAAYRSMDIMIDTGSADLDRQHREDVSIIVHSATTLDPNDNASPTSCHRDHGEPLGLPRAQQPRPDGVPHRSLVA